MGAPGSVDITKEAAQFEPRADTTPVFGHRNLLIALVLFVVALLSLFALQHDFHIPSFGVSAYPHYLYQAESYLHGRWDLPLKPPVTDIIVINGRNYIVYPPFPAILLMPLVAIFGLSTSDTLF